MRTTTRMHRSQALMWCCWFVVLLVLPWVYGVSLARLEGSAGHPPRAGLPPTDASALALVVVPDPQPGVRWPWLARSRWRKWALARYQAAQRAYRRAVWAARGARLLLSGALTMAAVVDLLTRAQLRRNLGALPVLHQLLDILQVRQIINRHCPSAAAVDQGAVVVVLVLNRLLAPRPLYKVADWVGQTVLQTVLGVPAAKFNDDRLGRTLDAIAPQARAIWLDIVDQALLHFDLDLRFLFYDLTALVMQGEFAESDLVDYGFAHNTPSGKQKIKVGATATADGNVPLEYDALSGRTADLATVQQNMERLCRLLERHGCPRHEVLVIGDRGTLNDELAVTYDRKQLKYLAGLQPQQQAHRDLLIDVPEVQFYAHPLTTATGTQADYFGLPCCVTFTHEGKTVTHRGLIVLSGPMRRAVRQGRARQLHDLRAALTAVRTKIGQPRYRSVRDVQARANTCLRRSPVGHLLAATAYQGENGQVDLRWQVDGLALFQAMQHDGRYLLVTNDWQLAPARILALYRSKDGLEKRFEVAKQDLHVRPLYVHSDARIQAMLLLNMLALLAYSLLERQARRRGLVLTTRRIIEQLETLTIIETHCWDGSLVRRLTPVDAEQAELLAALAQLLTSVLMPRRRPALPSAAERTTPQCQPPPGVLPA